MLIPAIAEKRPLTQTITAKLMKEKQLIKASFFHLCTWSAFPYGRRSQQWMQGKQGFYTSGVGALQMGDLVSKKGVTGAEPYSKDMVARWA